MADNRVVLLGCGDMGPIHEPVEPFSALVRPMLAAADLRFAQCERVYSERGEQQTQGSPHARLKPHMASVFSDCGFDVVSVASNHAMDFGEDALLDTIENFRQRGIQAIGGGRNIVEARQPAIIERNGVRVAFLAYCSVLPTGYAAGPKRAGLAPIRVHTYYHTLEYQPGVPPRIVTVPYEEDVAAMVEDIAAVRKRADVVVVSMHWGIHFIPKMIAEYQPIVAKAAFAAGADLILGHHPHIAKGIGVHGGKACFYSLASFIMSTSGATTDHLTGQLGIKTDPDYPGLPYGPDAHRSLVAKAVLSRGGVDRVSFLPMLIDKQLRPVFLRQADPRFAGEVQYIRDLSEDFGPRFTVEGDEVIVSTN